MRAALHMAVAGFFGLALAHTALTAVLTYAGP